MKKRMKSGMQLAKIYRLNVQSAHCHDEGNWYWNLKEFPGAYFDSKGYILFQTERDYTRCVYLSIGPENTGVRNKDVGMSIADIPGYQLLDPPPISL